METLTLPPKRQEKQREKRGTRSPALRPGYQHVFGCYPKREGCVWGFLEIDNETYDLFRARANETGLTVSEELAGIMERHNLPIDRHREGGF